jgi:hypothetical protein
MQRDRRPRRSKHRVHAVRPPVWGTPAADRHAEGVHRRAHLRPREQGRHHVCARAGQVDVQVRDLQQRVVHLNNRCHTKTRTITRARTYKPHLHVHAHVLPPPSECSTATPGPASAFTRSTRSRIRAGRNGRSRRAVAAPSPTRRSFVTLSYARDQRHDQTSA